MGAFYILLVAATVQASLQNVFVGSGEMTGPDIMNGGELNEPWRSMNYSSSEIDNSSYVKFFIWSDLPDTEVNVQVEPPMNMLMMPFIYEQEPIQDLESKHVVLPLSLCTAMQLEFFYVWFECYQASESAVQISIESRTEPFQRQNVSFGFKKKCGRGIPRDDINITVDDKIAVSSGVVEDDWADGSQLMSSVITQINLAVFEGLQYIENIEITSDIKIEHRGPATSAHLITKSGLKSIMKYECGDLEGIYDVSYSIKIPPYTPIKIRWQKRCGEEPITAQFVSIGTQARDSDVILAGQLQPTFSSFAVGDETDITYFYVKSEQGKFLQLYEPIITVNQQIMRPMILQNEVEPYPVLISHNEVVFGIRYRCIESGLTDVQLTLAFIEEFIVEFKYKKACKKPHAYVQKQDGSMIQTVATIFGVFIFLALVFKLGSKLIAKIF